MIISEWKAGLNKCKSVYFLALLMLWPVIPVLAQPPSIAVNWVKEEQGRFTRDLYNNGVDSLSIPLLANYFDAEVTEIHTSIKSNRKLKELEKDKAIRSLVFFIQELNKGLAWQKINIYEIPGALKAYNSLLTAILSQKSIINLMAPLSPRLSQLLATSFSQYKESALLDDIAVYKRMASSPEFILQYLESKPRYRFADSLLIVAAANDPLQIVYYLGADKPGVKERILNAKNIYIQEMVSLAKDKYVSELLPFVKPLAEKIITPEEILGKRADIKSYFQMLVNTLQDAVNSPDPPSAFLDPLREGIRQKAFSFYVNPINELHNAGETTRFASVKDLRPEDLYYIITSCGAELYTSSYLGLYKRLMEHFKEQSADALFEKMYYDNYHIFIRLAANYNVLDDFLKQIPRENQSMLLKRFIDGIESDTYTGLERAMDIADCFSALVSDPEIIDIMQTELESNLSRCTVKRQYLGIRLYRILLEVLEQVKQKDNRLWATLGNYEVLKRDALTNKNGEIVQLVLFYGDEDGIASFNDYMKLFGDKSKWEIVKKENWVSIHSVADPQFIIYANRPLSIKEQLDVHAQDSLIAFLHGQSLEPTILVHRGHSYHMDKTLRRMEPSVKLAILGSCGGYNKAISIATINPDVQVIASKQKGSTSINNAILSAINESLVKKEDLAWTDVWKKLEDRFRGDEASLRLFNEYFPPSKNVSLFVLKLFAYYRGYAADKRLVGYTR